MEIKKVTYTGHAKNRAKERCISEEIILKVVQNPDKRVEQRKGDHGGFVYKFNKQIENFDYKVIAEVKKGSCWVMTTYKTKVHA